LNYYRIKQTDYDGKFTYSPVKTARVKKNTENLTALVLESVYPNPFSDNFKVNFSLNKSGIVTVVLYNSSGQIILQDKVESVDGINTYDFFHVYNLKDGVYFVALIYNDEKVIQKLIKH
jgi:hypothetical protein